MPGMADLAALAVDGAFRHLGTDAIWTPQGGQAVAIRVIASGESVDYGPAGSVRMHGAGMVLEALASVVAAGGLGQAGSIRAGDQLVVLGESRTVSGAPEYRDPERLVVLIETRRT